MSQGNVKEYVVRMPKSSKKKFHMMRFSADQGSDFFKTWSQCKMERENNAKQYKYQDDNPKFGAGSEFGKEQREEARRKKYGFSSKKYKMDDQPWMLNIGGKNGKKFKGIRDGGVADNVSWYIFMQAKDGTFEAYSIEEWYNFQSIQRYKALSAEEAEEQFVKRDKVMNYFQIMYEKKFKKENNEGDEEEPNKKNKKKSLKLSEMDDWVSDDQMDDNSDNQLSDDDKKTKKKKTATKRKAGGKKRRDQAGDSGESYEEESDDFNEGQEFDYISGDSSDSDQENDEKVRKELAGVDQEDALKKLLNSDDEEEDSKHGSSDEDEKDEENGGQENGNRKKKKNNKKNRNSKERNGDSKSNSDNDETKNTGKDDKNKIALNEIKKKVKANPYGIEPPSKRSKLDNQHMPGTSGLANPSAGENMEDAIRKYLTRKPMTTTELLKNFKKKKDMSSEQLVTSIAQILKKINPTKKTFKGKMYLSLRSDSES